MAKRIAYDVPVPKPQCQNSLRTDFYLYFLRRPDKVDPLDPSKGQPFYVGKGSNGRAGNHRIEANFLKHKPGRKSHKINIIHKLWRQGLDFQEEIIINDHSEEDAIALEIAAIEQYGRIDKKTGCLANLTDGGDGVSGFVHSSESKEKISKASRGNKSFSGKTHAPESKEKISRNNIGKHGQRKGQTLPEEHKENIRQSLLGKTHSEERKEKNRQSHLGKITPEHKQGISKAQLGRKHTEEHKEKNRQAQLGKKRSPETRERMSQAQLLRWQRQREARNGN